MAKRKQGEEREFALVYLVERLYKGDIGEIVKPFGLKDYQIKAYYDKWVKVVDEQIAEENRELAFIDQPDITDIKKLCINNMWKVIKDEKDPSKLARVYATMSEFENVDSSSKASISESIMEGLAKAKIK